MIHPSPFLSSDRPEAMFFHSLIFALSATLFLLIITPSHAATAKSPTGPQINITKHLSFPYFRSNHDLTFLGSAAVSPQTACILIPQYKAGRAIYSSPVRLLDPQTRSPVSFTTTFSFRIHNPAARLGFIIVPDEFTVGWPGPCEDHYKVVAVVFDTRMNPEFAEPDANHEGLNLGSTVPTISINASDFGLVHRAWITYDGNRKFLEIYLGSDGVTIPNGPAYSGNLDLLPYLNEYMFVGFSGSTGGNHTEVYSICSWNFTSASRAFLRVASADSCPGNITVDKNFENVSRKTLSSFYIFMSVLVLVLMSMTNLYFNRKLKRKPEPDEIVTGVSKEKQWPGPPTQARKLTFSLISSATRSFAELQILGSDSRSTTYKGSLANGTNVAVKRFQGHFFGAEEWGRRRMIKEVKAVGKVRHPNLVSIRGWCFDRHETIVVYNFIPNGSLDDWLCGFGALPWTRRLKVVKDVAEGLSYLHSKGLAHKNVKMSSVFLDTSFRALVGDFGFVLLSVESTRFASMVSQKVDIFEFGVLVLEVVSGRGRRGGPGELDLLDVAWAMHESGEKGRLVDRRMGAVVNQDQAIRVVEIGLMCTLNDNKGRPTMEEVAEYLNMERAVPDLPTNRPVSLFPYSSTTGLCSGYTCAPFT